MGKSIICQEITDFVGINTHERYILVRGDFMSYQIQYNPDFWKCRPAKKGRLRSKVNILGIILCVFALFISLRYGTTIKDFLIPGDPAVTTAAVDHLMDNLKEGNALKDALTDFCYEILECGKND